MAKKRDKLQTSDAVLANQMAMDPEFAREWQRTTLARQVAIEVIRYRAEQDITQTELARRLGMKQSQVARLEAGKKNPTIETLIRLAGTIGFELAIDIAPAEKAKRELVTAKAQGKRSQSYESEGVQVLVAAA